MLLRHSHTSPFVRKVTVLLHETGLADQVALETVDGWSEPDDLTGENPLSMVPTLVLEDGRTLFDSPVICEYLDTRHSGPRLLPEVGDRRWQVLREQALADGILESAVLIFLETVRRPEALRWGWWVTLKQRAIERSLDELETRVRDLERPIDLGLISVGVALSYLDLRQAVGEWRARRPGLATWHSGFSKRPSMLATSPPA
jgi:glutathione S-transferase